MGRGFGVESKGTRNGWCCWGHAKDHDMDTHNKAINGLGVWNATKRLALLVQYYEYIQRG